MNTKNAFSIDKYQRLVLLYYAVVKIAEASKIRMEQPLNFPTSEVQKLPFPLNPAEFWAKGMVSLYGSSHFLIGISPDPNVTEADGTPLNVGPLFGGMILSFGGGLAIKGKNPKISVQLSLKDVKFINLDGGFALEYDSTRRGEDCSLVSMDPVLAFQTFSELVNPRNWRQLKAEFESNPKEFFRKYLKIFQPFGINLSFNVQSDIGPRGSAIPGFILKRGLINSKPIWIKAANQMEFPPNNLGLTPEEPIILIDVNNKRVVTTRIESMHSIWVHPFFEQNTESVCQAIVEGTLSYNTVRDYARKYIQPTNI